MKKNKEKPTRSQRIKNIKKIFKNTNTFNFISYFKDKKCNVNGKIMKEIKKIKNSK